MPEPSQFWLKIAFVAAGALAFIVVGGIIIMLVLLTGTPGEPRGTCRNPDVNPRSATSQGLRHVFTDTTLANQWQLRWDEFEAILDAGSPAGVTFTEGEVTSRAARWAEETDAPIGGVTVCFHDGIAEARGHAEVPVLSGIPLLGGAFETNVRALGRIDLSSAQPRVTITDVDAGNLPDWMVDRIRDDLETAVSTRLAGDTQDHTYTVTYREGELEVTGQP